MIFSVTSLNLHDDVSAETYNLNALDAVVNQHEDNFGMVAKIYYKKYTGFVLQKN